MFPWRLGGPELPAPPARRPAAWRKDCRMATARPSVWLHELTWEDVDAYLQTDDIVIWPIGATEQHGPAGPLGVDSFVANALAEDAAKETGVLCVPPLWYGD